MIALFASAWGLVPCAPGAVQLGPDDQVAAYLDRNRLNDRIELALLPGVYAEPLDFQGYSTVELCGTGPGVILTGSHQPALIHGAQGLVLLKNLTLAPVNTSAVSVVLNAGTLGMAEVDLTPSGIGATVVVSGQGSLDIATTQFVGGTASTGAHVLIDGDIEATVTDSTLLNAVATGAGGSIKVGASARLTVEDSTFRNNRGGQGGAIASEGALILRHVTFEGNRAECQGACLGELGRGGAVWSSNAEFVMFDETALFGNRASADGGALSVRLGEFSVLREVTLCQNIAGGNGGGLHAQDGSVGRFGGLRFLDNVAAKGGGASGPVDLINVTLLGNAALEQGSAVHCSDLDRTCSVERSLLAFNTQVGVIEEQRVLLTSSTLWGNTGKQDFDETNQIADPVLRGYQPGGDCGQYRDFPAPLSPVVLGRDTSDVEGIDTLGLNRCEMLSCRAPAQMRGAYGLLSVDVSSISGFEARAWKDADGDGWPAIFDCDDSNGMDNPSVNYASSEGVDQDCDGVADYDGDGDGFLRGEGDCDDGNPDRYPGAPDDDPFRDDDCDHFIEDRIPTYRPSGCGRTRVFDREGAGCNGGGQDTDTDSAGLPGLGGLLLGLLLLWRRSHGDPPKR